MDGATASLLASSLATLTVGVLTYMREGRAHRWAREQSEADAKARLEQAEIVKQERLETAAALKEHTARNLAAAADRVVDQVGEAREEIKSGARAAAAAYEVANNVNDKLVAIGEARVKGGSEADRRTKGGT